MKVRAVCVGAAAIRFFDLTATAKHRSKAA